ncbi:MAG TPA: polymorphic toxin type 44 domain-containing protein [Chitinispirillaceae bacterium]|nr:polymorphic toxin type 44 domain-containing protein [Chitinispirillaceae bacterium]
MAIKDYDDPSMFTVGSDGGLSLIGQMGGIVDITYMFDNMLKNNGVLAQQMNPIEFYQAVKTGGIWDFKNKAGGLFWEGNKGNYQLQYNLDNWSFDDPGNYHFGYVSEKFGLNPVIAQMGAGAYQIYSGTSSKNYWKSYFDDPRDSKMIGRGYNAALQR